MNAVRIAMWSGPRNISTAMMRAWENRPDTTVIDEPFYAHYLAHTDFDHPGKADVIAHYETDWHAVAQMLTGPVPDGKSIFYQKHMTHHMLPHIGLDWLADLRHAFLIREPRAMLISLNKVIPQPKIEQTGLPQQVRLFETVQQVTGQTPPVIAARDVLSDPRRALSGLCAALNVPFDEGMLAWPPGKRATDGIWAPYWYATVEQSTGFAPYQPTHDPLPDHLADLLAACQPLYDQMAAHRLTL